MPKNLVSRDIEWFKLCGECNVWESRLVCKKAVARVKLLVPDFRYKNKYEKKCFDCYCKERSPLPPDVRASTKKASHLRRRGHDFFVNKVTLQFLRNAFLDSQFFFSRSAIFFPLTYDRKSILVQKKKASSYLLMRNPQRRMRGICFIEYIILLSMR